MTTRLRRSRPDGPGWTRRRYGRGTVYLDERGERIVDEAARDRLDRLAIPPAWRQVWICPDPRGHIQAVGTDAAGRRQYLYHEGWNRRRARRKYDHALVLGAALPTARRRTARLLTRPEPTRQAVLALAFRLLDRAYLRIGSEAYSRQHGSFGLATVRREHAQIIHADGRPAAVRLCFPAKSGQVRDVTVADPATARLLTVLIERDDPGAELLAWCDEAGWHDVTSDDIRAWVRELVGVDCTVKEFRTWHATVIAADALARSGPPPASERGRTRVLRQVAETVAAELGNTPAVARASYIDPRVLDLWADGVTIGRTASRRAAEAATLRLLSTG